MVLGKEEYISILFVILWKGIDLYLYIFSLHRRSHLLQCKLKQRLFNDLDISVVLAPLFFLLGRLKFLSSKPFQDQATAKAIDGLKIPKNMEEAVFGCRNKFYLNDHETGCWKCINRYRLCLKKKTLLISFDIQTSLIQNP